MVKEKAGNLKSSVWKHFTKVKVDGQDKAQCNYCKKYLGGKSKNGTTHLHGHYRSCLKRKMNPKNQTVFTPKLNAKGKQEMVAATYDPENAKLELAKAIIIHEYPHSIVDHHGFKRYSASLQPLFHVPSRNTIKKEIIKIYESEKMISMKLLDTNEGRVAIPSDMWTSGSQKRGYMAVTGHYIDSSWTLQSCILRFIYVPAPHTRAIPTTSTMLDEMGSDNEDESMLACSGAQEMMDIN
ncbi:hypothetical protein RIF29_21079 [Crotalaria pallida]|uniref:BED-type domain-containing protein n=1 Tax=Crotalaria pallida TaxID=3830 RepID=A0AAN9F5W3_CROPI